MSRVIVVDGYYGAGKTTYCKAFCKEYPSFTHLVIDHLCQEFRGDRRLIHENAMMIIMNSVEDNKDIIIDFYFKDTWKDLLKDILDIKNRNLGIGVEVKYIRLNTSIEESYKRFISRYQNMSKMPSKITFENYKRRCEID